MNPVLCPKCGATTSIHREKIVGFFRTGEGVLVLNCKVCGTQRFGEEVEKLIDEAGKQAPEEEPPAPVVARNLKTPEQVQELEALAAKVRHLLEVVGTGRQLRPKAGLSPEGKIAWNLVESEAAILTRRGLRVLEDLPRAQRSQTSFATWKVQSQLRQELDALAPRLAKFQTFLLEAERHLPAPEESLPEVLVLPVPKPPQPAERVQIPPVPLREFLVETFGEEETLKIERLALPPKCEYERCENLARATSRYCSDRCRAQRARDKYTAKKTGKGSMGA